MPTSEDHKNNTNYEVVTTASGEKMNDGEETKSMEENLTIAETVGLKTEVSDNIEDKDELEGLETKKERTKKDDEEENQIWPNKLRKNSNELKVTKDISTNDNASLCSDFDRELSDDIKPSSNSTAEVVEDPNNVKNKFITAVQKVTAVPKVPESRSTESPYKIPEEDMVYIRKLTRYLGKRDRSRALLRIYIRSLTEQREKKEILQEIKNGYRKGEISTREYFEAIYLQLSEVNFEQSEENVEKITNVVEEEHFDEVRKFINQNPQLGNVACYDIGKIIEVLWCNCGRAH